MVYANRTAKLGYKSAIYLFTCSSFKDMILKFYRQQLSDQSLFREWLPALPLLHFLRGESKPFEDLICEKSIDISKWKWWGLQGLPCKDFRWYWTVR